MQIRLDDPRNPQATALLQQHLQDMQRHSPAESIHALDIDGLCQPSVTFWTAWASSELLGCGALAALDSGHGEIKSMRTASAHRRQGVAAAILQHIVAEALRRGYTRLSLETGSAPAFAPARMLYARFGFELCPPFGPYVLDPYSVFMHRLLTPADE